MEEEPRVKEDIVDHYNECSDLDSEYDVDPEYESYIQNSFQDEIILDIYNNLVSYIRDQALPMCEFIEQEDIEDIINVVFLDTSK